MSFAGHRCCLRLRVPGRYRVAVRPMRPGSSGEYNLVEHGTSALVVERVTVRDAGRGTPWPRSESPPDHRHDGGAHAAYFVTDDRRHLFTLEEHEGV